MKKELILTILLAVIPLMVNSQHGVLERSSFDISYGYNAPLYPVNNFKEEKINRQQYSGLLNLQLGITYHINDKWSVRGSYMMAHFNNSNSKSAGIEIQKLAGEVAYMLYSDLSLSKANYSHSNFELYVHAGAGFSKNLSKSMGTEDFMANIQAGFKPTYNLSRRFAIFLNPVYIMNFSQHTGFDGIPLKSGGKPSIGGFYTVNLGGSVRLGI